jgi:hypothetical protein
MHDGNSSLADYSANPMFRLNNQGSQLINAYNNAILWQHFKQSIESGYTHETTTRIQALSTIVIIPVGNEDQWQPI